MRAQPTVSLVSSGHSASRSPALLLQPVSTSSRNDDLVQVVKDIARWITTNISYDVEMWTGCQGQVDINALGGSDWADVTWAPDCNEQGIRDSCTGDEVTHRHWQCLDSTSVPLRSSSIRVRPLVVPPCSPQTHTHHPCASSRQSAGKQALLQGKATCRGYSDLFCLLCRHAGIRATKIQGLVKTAAYFPGNPLDLDQPNHEWNAVWIQGLGWKLIDLTWAAGHVAQHPRHFRRDFNDYFLFTDPRNFIRDHFPCDQKWQLLTDPLTIADFENDLFLKPGYFINGIKSYNLTSGVHHCFEESMDITFRLSKPMLFTYSLTQVYTGLNMDQCVMCRWSSQECVFRLYLPRAGHYVFCVYGRPSITAQSPMTCLLTQTIHSHWGKSPRLAVTRLALLPDSLLWGPTSHFESLRLRFQSDFSSRLPLRSGIINTPVILSATALNMAVVVYPYRDKHRAFSSNGKLLTRMQIKHQAAFRLKVNNKMTKLWRLAIFAQGLNSQVFICICNFLMIAESHSSSC